MAFRALFKDGTDALHKSPLIGPLKRIRTITLARPTCPLVQAACHGQAVRAYTPPHARAESSPTVTSAQSPKLKRDV